MIRFIVPGIPQGKGRPRITSRGGSPRAYTPQKTVAYEGLIALAAQEAASGAKPLSGPVAVDIVAWFPIPASWSKKRQAEAYHHTSKPDADNIVKAVGDGLNGVLWNDDSQVALCSIVKRYGIPGLAVTVRPL